MASVTETIELDLDRMSLRELNQFLHHKLPSSDGGHVEVLHPNGRHSIAVGLDVDADVHIHGHAGYYVAGMNKRASITVHGNVGWGVAENIMSGVVRVKGNASASAASSGHGGLVIIEGNAASRCGISMKGCDIVVGGSVGHVSGFMAQLGRLVVCEDAGAGLGDSLYEAVIYVRGEIASLGADAREEPLSETDLRSLAELLDKAGFSYNPNEFKRVASARTLYHWNAAHFGSYG